jgi:hypothetical protein
MTKLYAICSKQAYEKTISLFHYQHGSHFLDLPDGRVFVMGVFGDEFGESEFCAMPGVEVLPDPMLQGNQELKPEHAQALAHLKPEGNTVLHAARSAGAVHPLMKLRSFM